MKERPILFSGPMVRAILDGRKTQTRRVVKPQPSCMPGFTGCSGRWHNAPDVHGYPGIDWCWITGGVAREWKRCPYGVPGDRLWVRETFARKEHFNSEGGTDDGAVVYLADYPSKPHASLATGVKRWRPSIFMPRWASRITLEVTAVRVERVQEIEWEDIIREGAGTTDDWGPGLTATWVNLWDSINGKRPGCAWADNPWVWVVEFKRVNP